MEYTRRVAEFVVGTRFEDILASAVAMAKGAILDAVGVALAGSQEEAGEVAAGLARDEGGREEAAVFGHHFRTGAAFAAFANGVATHAMDFDASFTMMGQPMAGLAAATFAQGQASGVSGRELLTAYLVGYETTGKLVWSMPAKWGDGGWHATATLGTLGCTAAASRLLGLDAERTSLALGIASSMASGSVGNFGTMSKPLHAGLAARNGVQAARLAQRGFTGNNRMLDGPFYETFAPEQKPELERLDELGKSWEVENGVRYKAYPSGGLAHTAIDAVLALRAEHQISPDAVARIDVKATPYTASRIVFRVPETELQAKFSMPYLLSRSLINGAVTLDHFGDEAIRDPQVIALAERIFMEADPSLDRAPRGGRPSIVTVQLTNGQTLERRVDFPKGSPEAPMSQAELEAKFLTCARHALDETVAQRVMAMLKELESLSDLSELGELLAGGPVPAAARA
jgi:2-methylcitrate dehydratase PrpD